MKPLPEVAIADRRQPTEPESYIDDWLFVKPMVLRKGEAAVQHVHEYDHPTFIGVGKIEAWVDGLYIGDFQAFSHITIKAGQQHRFVAVTDALIFCIHNLRGEGYPATREG